jgi:hypothetical protein
MRRVCYRRYQFRPKLDHLHHRPRAVREIAWPARLLIRS